MLLNPEVNPPVLAMSEISKPRLIAKRTKDTVVAVTIVNPRIVNLVWLFLLDKSLSGNEIALTWKLASHP
jgi:hypothetical protein